MESSRIMDCAGVEIVRPKMVVTPDEFKIKGLYEVEQYRGGELINRVVSPNLITTQGKRYILDAALDNSAGGFTLQTAWYVALVSSNTSPVVGMTYAVPVYTETSDYSEANRPTWAGVVDGSAGSITNSASKAAFTITAATISLYGASLVSGNTKGDVAASEYLFSYSQFGSAISAVTGDVINVTITITLT